ncbi:MAG TPA: response regulator [Acidobacteriaceae bacterium]|nr:response regulator [Acidobacteriaceae bacterium]
MTQSDLRGRRVLVVEDESRIAMLIRDTLEDLGCQVVAIASRLEEARARAASLEFDVALLDVDLHGEPGYPVADELAARDIPFVLVTGYGAPAVPADLEDAPSVQKPFLRAELERALRIALGC